MKDLGPQYRTWSIYSPEGGSRGQVQQTGLEELSWTHSCSVVEASYQESAGWGSLMLK